MGAPVESETSMSWTAAELPDLTGRRAVVTGANTGLGAVAATTLARHGAELVLAVRDPARAEPVATAITEAGGVASVETLDLASQESIADFAQQWSGPIDLLLNNAGVMAPRVWTPTVDGHELQFGTNHLGHFALTGRLVPHLLESDSPRVVTVASIAHGRGDAGVLQGNPREGYDPQESYGQSKLANLLFADELHRRATAAGSRLTSTAAHPGVSNTSLFTRRDGMGANWFVRTFGPLVMTLAVPGPERSADSLLYAATLAEAGSYTGPTGPGETRGAVGVAKRSAVARDADLGRRLWERSEELTGVTWDFGAAST